MAGVNLRVRDDSGYAKHRDPDRLFCSLRNWDAIVANVVGRLGDAFGGPSASMIAPIKERPDFEHLEARASPSSETSRPGSGSGGRGTSDIAHRGKA